MRRNKKKWKEEKKEKKKEGRKRKRVSEGERKEGKEINSNKINLLNKVNFKLTLRI